VKQLVGARHKRLLRFENAQRRDSQIALENSS
jgi:hypothetical protein